MRWLAAILVLLLSSTLASAEPSPTDPVAYSLSPEFENGALSALRVEIRFREGPSGRTRLAWIKSWAGDDKLWRHARDMRIEGGEANPDGPGAWIVRAAPGTPITATYRVVSAYDHDPTDDDSHQSWPVIRPTWFYAVGESLFAQPEDRDKAPATFAWKGPARGFGFASDLEHLAGPDRRAARPGTLDDIVESIAVGGRDLRMIEQQADGAHVRVALIGRYRFDDQTFARQVFQILRTEREFWREPAQPYLVAMSPTVGGPARLSVSGTGRTDAFALWIDPSSQPADLRWLLAHEYFHSWNPTVLGGLPDDATEPAGYWFSEGFTDYYAWKLMLNSNQFGAADFVTRWNYTLRNYANSPVRAAPNSVIVTDFWKSETTQKLPYQRGAILAATLDQQAREHGSSLDAAMREMRRLAGSPGAKRRADELFAVAYQAVVGVDPRPLIDRHMIAGEPIALPAGAFGPCFVVKTVEVPVFERGWDPDATGAAGQVITGLRDDTPAYAAGLRNGMKVLQLMRGEPGDATVAYLMRVKPADGPEQLINFLPAGKARASLQEVETVPGLAGCPA